MYQARECGVRHARVVRGVATTWDVRTAETGDVVPAWAGGETRVHVELADRVEHTVATVDAVVEVDPDVADVGPGAGHVVEHVRVGVDHRVEKSQSDTAAGADAECGHAGEQWRGETCAAEAERTPLPQQPPFMVLLQ